MRLFLVLALVAALSLWACGLGDAGDSGAAFPGPTYWGWECWDGSQATDAGCPPQPDAGDAGP